MTTTEGPSRTHEALLSDALRQFAVERFYTEEAALLDAHRYDEWVELFSDDTHYFMPIRRTMLRKQLGLEFTKPGEIAFFDDNKDRACPYRKLSRPHKI